MNRLVLAVATAITAVSFYSAIPAKAGSPIVPEVEALITFEAVDEAQFYEEHALNDAWLGLPFHGLSGDVIGYVVDAPVNDYDEVTEIHVGQIVLDLPEAAEANNSDPIVFRADQVELQEDRIVLLPADNELMAILSE